MRYFGSTNPLGDKDGFLISLFDNHPSNEIYIQNVSRSGVVIDFLAAQAGYAAPYISPNTITWEIGMPEFFEFKYKDNFYRGPQVEVREKLIEVIDDLRDQPVLRFNVLQFCKMADSYSSGLDDALNRISQVFGIKSSEGWKKNQVFQPIFNNVLFEYFENLEILHNKKMQHAFMRKENFTDEEQLLLVIPEFLPKVHLKKLNEIISYTWSLYTKKSPIKITYKVISEDLEVAAIKKESSYFFSTGELIALISKLRKSGTFARTHSLIEKLSKYKNFDIFEIEELIDIATSNNQIGWIIHDADVLEFYKDLKSNLHKRFPEHRDLYSKVSNLLENK